MRRWWKLAPSIVESGHFDFPPDRYLILRVEPPAISAHYAVCFEMARNCPMLREILDDWDTGEQGEEQQQTLEHSVIEVPETDPLSLEAVLEYLEQLLVKVPTNLPRPLRVPLPDLLQPWELQFLYTKCLVNGQELNHEPLLGIMHAADYLMLEPLRDLSCAFLASLVMKCNTQEELLAMLKLDRPYTAAEFEPLYEKYPFLRLDGDE